MDANKKPVSGGNRETGRGSAFHNADLTANLKHFRNAIILSGFIDGAVLAIICLLVLTIVERAL
jgi:hypothetical protein